MKKPNDPTVSEINYAMRRVAEWIAAGDMIEPHARLAIDAVTKGYALARDTFGQKMSLAEFCDIYHAALKSQETMDPKEFYRKKRMLNRARRDLLSGKAKPPWDT